MTYSSRENSPELFLECAGLRFSASVFDLPADAEQNDSPEGARLRAFLMSSGALPEVQGQALPGEGWRRLAKSADEVTYGRGEPPTLTGHVTLRLDGGTWREVRFGGRCVTRPFREGLNVCRWGLDPGVPPPGEGSNAIHVIVNDSQCASGVGPENRLQEPDVEVTDETVTILFTTKALTGVQLCPGHPAAKRVVQLDEPLGLRRLLDGGIYPSQSPCRINSWGNIVGPTEEFGG